MATADALRDLYRRTILEHSREPHHFGRLEQPDREATGHNPLCGDKCTVYLQLETGTVSAIAFEGSGCAICMASASLMTDQILGEPLTAADQKTARVLGAFEPEADDKALAGDLAALAGVRDYPTRIRCATLPWQTLHAALRQERSPVTTDSQLRNL